MSSTQVKILVPGNHLMVGLLGQRDELLRLIEAAFGGAHIFVRGNEISIDGEDAERVGRLFEEMLTLLQQGHALDTANIGRTIEMVKADEKPSEVLTAEVLRSSRGRSVRPKSGGQKRYVDAIANNVITFGIGPAGTGKSYLAVALGVQALQAKQVQRIILTRPAVEAGERLGFLPGDLMAKIDPYLRPLYDALYDMLEPEGVQRLMERGTIEVAPLAFMRGRAQPLDEPVLTPTGWRAIGSLAVGDCVIGSDGESTLVLGVYPQGVRDVFRVRTEDGRTARACAEHLWTTRDGVVQTCKLRLGTALPVLAGQPALVSGVRESAKRRPRYSRHSAIAAIEPAGREQTVCIQVLARDSLYVTRDEIITHNTINNAFIILDEAQNTTPEQMKMFLTRIGFGTKAVVTGDVTQIDLAGARSGLLGLDKILAGIDGLEFVNLGSRDVVRHRIVQDIVNAYERI